MTISIEDARRLGIKTVPCETCGEPTQMTGTKRCDGCWEVEHRLRDYLKNPQGQVVIMRALVQARSSSICDILTVSVARYDLIDAVEKWANADCGAMEAEEVLGRLAKLNDLEKKPCKK